MSLTDKIIVLCSYDDEQEWFEFKENWFQPEELPKLEANGIPEDIDSFTIFGLFNKGITNDNRISILGGIAKDFSIASDTIGWFDKAHGLPGGAAHNEEISGEVSDKVSDKSIGNANLSDTEKQILSLIKENSAITQKELASRIGISEIGIRKAMAKLKKDGIITREGSPKKGSWKIEIGEAIGDLWCIASRSNYLSTKSMKYVDLADVLFISTFELCIPCWMSILYNGRQLN